MYVHKCLCKKRITRSHPKQIVNFYVRQGLLSKAMIIIVKVQRKMGRIMFRVVSRCKKNVTMDKREGSNA